MSPLTPVVTQWHNMGAALQNVLQEGEAMNRRSDAFRSNIRHARATWGDLSRTAISRLKGLSAELDLSVANGDLQLLEGWWYVTNAGLLRLAERKHCYGMKTVLIHRLSDVTARRWVFRATVFKTPRSKGFVGYGDADPSNTSPLVRGAEMRVAETLTLPAHSSVRSRSNPGEGLRRRFLWYRNAQGASRGLVESFIAELAASAEKDRDALVCKLNSYARPSGALP
jgi:hypothetical protein